MKTPVPNFCRNIWQQLCFSSIEIEKIDQCNCLEMVVASIAISSMMVALAVEHAENGLGELNHYLAKWKSLYVFLPW